MTLFYKLDLFKLFHPTRSPRYPLRPLIVVSTITTPEDAKDLFAEAQAAFAPIIGAPNDDNVKRLYEAFFSALQSINFPGGEVYLSDILLSEDDHKAKHSGNTFDRM